MIKYGLVENHNYQHSRRWKPNCEKKGEPTHNAVVFVLLTTDFFTFNSGKFVWKTHKNPPDPGLVETLRVGGLRLSFLRKRKGT